MKRVWLRSTLQAVLFFFPREGEEVWHAPRPPVLLGRRDEGGGGARLII